MADRPDTVPGIEIVDHDVYAAGIPHEAFARLRREAPVAWINETDGPGFWAVTRWRELTAVHRDPATFSSEIGGTEMEDLAPDARTARRTMLETDPPRHTELRRLVNPTFARRAVEQHRAHADRLVRQMLDEAVGGHTVEFVHAVARELPIRLLCDVMGLPPDDAPALFEWADAIILGTDPDYGDTSVDTDPYRLLPFRSPVSLQVFDYAQRLVRARRAEGADDLITVMADSLVQGAALSETEFNTFFLLLVIAGNETTRQSLSHGLVAFASHPDQLERVRADRSLVPGAVDEVLRWACPQIHFRRTATRDTELAGVPIAAGDKVVTWYLSANYDEAEFAEPQRFDVSRSPNRHVTFGGGGPHLCLGQWLARLEVQVFVEALCDMVGTIEITGPVERVRSNFINGIKRLPVVLQR